MANLIEVCFIFLSTALWFTEAYSGIRHRRSKRRHDLEIDSLKNTPTFDDNTLVDENIKNHETYWSYHHMGLNDNENAFYNNQINGYLGSSPNDDMGNSHEKIVVKRAINEDDKSSEDMTDNHEKTFLKREITNEENHSIEDLKNDPEKTIVRREIGYNNKPSTDEDSWAGLVISFSKLALPFIPKKITNLNLDWPQLEKAVRSFSYVTTSDVTERSLNDSPLMATIRATTAAATPMIMDGVRALLGMVLDFVDNAGFVTNGHAISRRGVSEGVLDDIMEAFTAILEHMTGAK